MTDFGVLMFPTAYSVSPPDLARAAEARGFESLFFPEHTHIPVSRQSPWPGGPELPKQYLHSFDPFVGLAAAAAVTSTIKLGTGITLITEHDPIVLAKQAEDLPLDLAVHPQDAGEADRALDLRTRSQIPVQLVAAFLPDLGGSRFDGVKGLDDLSCGVGFPAKG